MREEDIAEAPLEAPLATPDKMPVSGKSPSGKSRLTSGFSLSAYPRPTHIAMVYVLLLCLGGLGYLLVRIFSQLINEGGG